MRIAIDAMGGDHAPAAVVEGAVAAARELGLAVLLIGDRGRIDGELRRHRLQGLDLETRHASESIGMAEPATAALRKPDSSMTVGLRAVQEGSAAAFVYAGNTGAGMVLGAHVLGRSAGVDRPAIAVQVPTVAGQTILLDAGANVDCRPLHLVQFAMMGDAYARAIRRVASPRIGLLSNGVEDGKGSAAVRAAAPLLRRLPINFIGYIEGRDVSSGNVDVVVCDGFVGNVVLKGLEGFAGLIGDRLRSLFRQSFRTRIAGLLVRSALGSLARELDPRETGGALLLGLNGTVVKAHGSSDARAIRNAVALAADLSRADVSREVARGVAATLDLAVQVETEPGRARRLWSTIRGKLRREGRAEPSVDGRGPTEAEVEASPPPMPVESAAAPEPTTPKPEASEASVAKDAPHRPDGEGGKA
ncbi:MAG: phosphate acyltransferase PlsX [Deltaproteobacteria bacterium]|nr:phosphate acyltransferase PlsX [Deltaproteobacteria bacterium]